MIVIGLTGGIGSGKTTVANYFLELEIPVYFADLEAKRLMSSSSRIKKKIIAKFGNEAYNGNTLNRAYLASIVFNNKSRLQEINAIIHPEVAKHFSTWVKKQEAPYVIQENAILFESNTVAKFDYIITVTAPIDIRIQRVIERDSTTKEAVLSRINNQWDDKKKVALSNFVINNVTLLETKKQVKDLHKKLIKISKQYKS